VAETQIMTLEYRTYLMSLHTKAWRNNERIDFVERRGGGMGGSFQKGMASSKTFFAIIELSGHTSFET